MSSGLNLGRSLSECFGNGCCTTRDNDAHAFLNQGSCGLGGGLPPPPYQYVSRHRTSSLGTYEELSELDDLGLSGGDSRGEGG